MSTPPDETELAARSSHPTLQATLLMIGVAVALVLIAVAGVMT